MTVNDLNLNENKIIQKLSFIGIFGNIVLCFFKFFAGFLGNSAAMISDAIHSLSDVFATSVAYFGANLSRQKADKEHPYGHERIECAASLILGLILFLTGILIGFEGIKKLFFVSETTYLIPTKIAFIASIVSIVVKEAMFIYTRHWAKIIKSDVFMADAWHHRTDVFSSIISLVAIASCRFGFKSMDIIGSILISFFIIKIAYDILKDSLKKMLDTSCDDCYIKDLNDFILSQKGVICIDMLNTRIFGSKVYIDLEIKVDGEISLKEAHAIAENVHSNVENRFSNIKHVMIHVNPS